MTIAGAGVLDHIALLELLPPTLPTERDVALLRDVIRWFITRAYAQGADLPGPSACITLSVE